MGIVIIPGGIRVDLVIVRHEIALQTKDFISSNPAVGKCKVTGIYVDPGTGKLIVEYDDTPKT